MRKIPPGDVVWIVPGIKHWHGASTRNGMSHIAIQEAVHGKHVEWLGRLGYGQYRD